MKVVVSRTSLSSEDKPCEEAQLEQATYVDYRNIHSLAEMRSPELLERLRDHDGLSWFERGTNHREENGLVARDLGLMSVWVLEIPDLESLVTMFQKYGELIIRSSDYKGFPLGIEIYDGYRE